MRLWVSSPCNTGLHRHPSSFLCLLNPINTTCSWFSPLKTTLLGTVFPCSSCYHHPILEILLILSIPFSKHSNWMAQLQEAALSLEHTPLNIQFSFMDRTTWTPHRKGWQSPTMGLKIAGPKSSNRLCLVSCWNERRALAPTSSLDLIPSPT